MISINARKEQAVRDLLDGPPPTVPPQLARLAADRGRRLLRRRLLLRGGVWLLLVAALVALTVWAVVSGTWVDDPAETTPDFEGW
ncbi:hypothetical protein [Streptomyces synnematoformans]|uniref:DUF3040 domain-containing protein n=1 Tax=Streptomyces synnematoformans TaxID=415721 RepID=A0ABN2Y0X8_9ACTN